MKRLLASLAALMLVVRILPGQVAVAAVQTENEVVIVQEGSRVTVSGYKFEDVSGEGVWNEDEQALSGWTIYAYAKMGDSHAVLASAVTDETGYYEFFFDNWFLGDVFYVAEQLPAGWKQTLPGAYSNFEYVIGPNQGSEFTQVNFGNKIRQARCNGTEMIINGGFEDPVVTHENRWDTFVSGAIGLVWKVFNKDGSPSVTGLELQRGFNGWTTAEGEQFAELGGYEPVRISQEVDTIPGQVYKVSFAFSPRPDTPALDNAMNITWGDSQIGQVAAASAVSGQPDWQIYTYWVPATANTMALGFVDTGDAVNRLGTLIDDVSVICDQDNGRLLTGYKFDDINNDGIWDENENPVADWTIQAVKPIGSFSVPAAGPAVNSPIFESGKNYIVRARGVIDVGDGISADAMYALKLPNTTWTDVVAGYESEGSSLLDLQIDGVSPFWGEFNTAHTYFDYITGEGVTKAFEIKDVSPSNNSGSLSISVYEVIDTAVTDGNGQYEVEATDWLGEHLVIIMEDTQQPGWLQTFPGADHDYMHYVSWEEAWGKNWAYNFGNHYAVREVVPPTEDEPNDGPSLNNPTVILQKVFTNNYLEHAAGDFVFMLDGLPVPLNAPISVSPDTDHVITEAYADENGGVVSDDYGLTFSEECSQGILNLSAGQTITCTLTNTGVGDGQGGGSPTIQVDENNGGGGGGGGGSRSKPNNDQPNQPVPLVLGETDERSYQTLVNNIAQPEPVVFGVDETLPRTGLPVASLLVFGTVGLLFVSRRRK